MRTLECNYDDLSAEQPSVALVVLQSDEVLEQELRAWLPQHYRLLHTRIPNDTHVSAETLDAMADQLPASVSLLPKSIPYSVVAYGCTSASTLIGEARVEQLVQSILPDIAVTNPLTALKAYLAANSISRIALLTPYVPGVSKAMLDDIEKSGIEVVQSATFNEPNDEQVARISGTSVMNAMLELGQNEQCEAVFGACTNLRSLKFLERVEQQMGKPALTSNSVLAWHIQQLVGDDRRFA